MSARAGRATAFSQRQVRWLGAIGKAPKKCTKKPATRQAWPESGNDNDDGRGSFRLQARNFAQTRIQCCVLRAACCVLRAACCVLRAACCVLRAAASSQVFIGQQL
ncbi:hypothetical protein CK625_00410 [Vandammella animalimorsus]|uniref:Uncharacterized protein n=1 Tax=Vandammella animalimorsus TaxID=2029117 RepID=A0A2A2AJX9_9BURK|nr:hypothetical protein CK625_00410 [Vandammella animalimorsus]